MSKTASASTKTTCTKFLFPQCQFSVFMQLFYIYRLCRNLLEKVKLHAGNNEKLLFHVKLHLALWSCMTACHAGTAQRLVKTTILSIKRPLECDPPRGTSDDFTKFLLQKFVQTRSTELSLLSFRTVTPSACEYSRICSLMTACMVGSCSRAHEWESGFACTLGTGCYNGVLMSQRGWWEEGDN